MNRVIYLVCVALLAFTHEASGREWTSASGRFRFEADLMEITPDAVKVKLDNGRTERIPQKLLSDSDRLYIRNAEAKFRADQRKATREAKSKRISEAQKGRSDALRNQIAAEQKAKRERLRRAHEAAERSRALTQPQVIIIQSQPTTRSRGGVLREKDRP